jgi:hypothetical protein
MIWISIAAVYLLANVGTNASKNTWSTAEQSRQQWNADGGNSGEDSLPTAEVHEINEIDGADTTAGDGELRAVRKLDALPPSSDSAPQQYLHVALYRVRGSNSGGGGSGNDTLKNY